MTYEDRMSKADICRTTTDPRTWRILRARYLNCRCDYCLPGKGCNKVKTFSKSWKDKGKQSHQHT